MSKNASRTVVLCLLSALQVAPALAARRSGHRMLTPAGLPMADGLPMGPASGGWEDSRRYLEQRVLEQPGDVRSRLALAQLLVARPETLRTGIVQLAQLANDRTVGGEAIGSWRGALAFAGSDVSDIPLYQAYLRVRPQDAAVRARLADVQQGRASAGYAPMTEPLAQQQVPAPVAMAPAPAYAPVAPRRAAVAAALPVFPGASRARAVLPDLPSEPAALQPATRLAQPVARTMAAPVAAASAYDYPVQRVAAAPVRPLAETPAQAQVRSLQQEIDDIERGRIPEITAGMVIRSRQGEKGTSSLTDTEFPIQLKMDVGNGKFTAHVTPVLLNTGTPDLNALTRFGGSTALGSGDAGSQNASGIGVGVGYEQGSLAVDVATTPLGFRYTDINGGVRYRLPIGQDFSFSINLSRRAVTDSVLSFAGARDGRTGGQEWGGVSATGGRLDASYDRGAYGLYGYGGVYSVTGHNVESNTKMEAGAGVYWRVIRNEDSVLTAGLSLTALSYDKNLSYYTFGQGGYFSPQQFLSVAVPVDWQQRTGRMSYQVKGSLGVQHVQQDGANYFPLSQPVAGPFYSAQSKTGLGYNIAAALEYQLEPQWFLGGQFGLDNARDYRQFGGSVYVRYAFRPHEGPQVMPVNWLRSPYGS